MKLDMCSKIVSGYGIPGLPLFKLEDGRWVCTTNDLVANIGCSVTTLLHAAHNHRHRLSFLTVKNTHSKEFLRDRKGEFGLQRLRDSSRLWTVDDVLILIHAVHTKRCIDIQDAMNSHIAQTLREEYVPIAILKQVQAQCDAFAEQLEQEREGKIKLEYRVSMLEKDKRLSDQAREAVQEAASEDGRALNRHKLTKEFRAMN